MEVCNIDDLWFVTILVPGQWSQVELSHLQIKAFLRDYKKGSFARNPGQMVKIHVGKKENTNRLLQSYKVTQHKCCIITLHSPLWFLSLDWYWHPKIQSSKIWTEKYFFFFFSLIILLFMALKAISDLGLFSKNFISRVPGCLSQLSGCFWLRSWF